MVRPPGPISRLPNPSDATAAVVVRHAALPASCEVGGAAVHWASLDDPRLGRWELLSSAERARASGFRFALHRERYVRGRVALRLLLAERTGLAPAAVPLSFDAAGAPLPVDGLHFSLSHSADLAVFAIASGRRVGVDVEVPAGGVDAVASAFHADERRWVAGFAGGQRDHATLRIWTAKEAYLKALGVGLLRPLDAFAVVPHDNEALALRDPDDAEAATSWMLQALAAPGDAVATVAVEGVEAATFAAGP